MMPQKSEKFKNLKISFAFLLLLFLIYIIINMMTLFLFDAFLRLIVVLTLSIYFLAMMLFSLFFLKYISFHLEGLKIKKFEREVKKNRRIIISLTIILGIVLSIMLVNVFLLQYTVEVIVGSFILGVLEGWIFFIPKTSKWIDRMMKARRNRKKTRR